MAENQEAQIHGVADPTGQRDCLQAIDTAFLGLVAIRTKLMNELQDDFTGLRSSAQLFREIFFGVELPLDSPKTLIHRAGGPLRIIRVSYKETGTKLFALADVISAIPKFRTVFPIRSFRKLAAQLEEIREDDPDAEATWFVNRISTKNLQAALEAEARALASGHRRTSPLTHIQPTVINCGCCGELQSPVSLIATAFANLSCNVAATRWTGKHSPTPRPAQPGQPTKTNPSKAKRRSHGATR